MKRTEKRFPGPGSERTDEGRGRKESKVESSRSVGNVNNLCVFAKMLDVVEWESKVGWIEIRFLVLLCLLVPSLLLLLYSVKLFLHTSTR